MKFDSDNPFKIQPDSPAPLCIQLARKVRFGECDPMGVVWHGTYSVYFEEIREALAETCGITYETLLKEDVIFPIKSMFLDYCRPLQYGREYLVMARMHWTEAARINMSYIVTAQDGTVCTKGFSVQLMTDGTGALLLDLPSFYRNFANNWRKGHFSFLQRVGG